MEQEFYFIRRLSDNKLLQGTKKRGKSPPKLYTKGTANQVASFKQNYLKGRYEVVPVKVIYDE